MSKNNLFMGGGVYKTNIRKCFRIFDVDGDICPLFILRYRLWEHSGLIPLRGGNCGTKIRFRRGGVYLGVLVGKGHGYQVFPRPNRGTVTGRKIKYGDITVPMQKLGQSL